MHVVLASTYESVQAPLKLNPCTNLGVFIQVSPTGSLSKRCNVRSCFLAITHQICCCQLNDPNDARGYTSPVLVH